MSEIADVAYTAVITVTRFVSDPYWPNGFHAGVAALEIRYEVSEIGNGSRTEEKPRARSKGSRRWDATQRQRTRTRRTIAAISRGNGDNDSKEKKKGEFIEARLDPSIFGWRKSITRVYPACTPPFLESQRNIRIFKRRSSKQRIRNDRVRSLPPLGTDIFFLATALLSSRRTNDRRSTLPKAHRIERIFSFQDNLRAILLSIPRVAEKKDKSRARQTLA